MFGAIQLIVSLVLCKKVSTCTFYFNFVISIEDELVGWKHMEGLYKKLAGSNIVEAVTTIIFRMHRRGSYEDMLVTLMWYIHLHLLLESGFPWTGGKRFGINCRIKFKVYGCYGCCIVNSIIVFFLPSFLREIVESFMK